VVHLTPLYGYHGNCLHIDLTSGVAIRRPLETDILGAVLRSKLIKAVAVRGTQRCRFARADELAPESLSAVRDETRSSCVACTIGCEHIYGLRTTGAALAEPVAPGPVAPGASQGVRFEYENLFALGPLAGYNRQRGWTAEGWVLEDQDWL
jgi:aldehyde:ferredoxin oxidoreductase